MTAVTLFSAARVGDGEMARCDASQPVSVNVNPNERPARNYERAVVVLNLAGVTGRCF